MAINVKTSVLKSKYKGVYIESHDGVLKYQMRCTVKGVTVHACYSNEKQAAISYDFFRIKNGKQPVNVLKPNNKH